MKLTYWVAKCLKDSSVYSIRTRTKAECIATVNEFGNVDGYYDKPEKIEVEYLSGFDLISKALDEGGIE